MPYKRNTPWQSVVSTVMRKNNIITTTSQKCLWPLEKLYDCLIVILGASMHC